MRESGVCSRNTTGVSLRAFGGQVFGSRIAAERCRSKRTERVRHFVDVPFVIQDIVGLLGG